MTKSRVEAFYHDSDIMSQITNRLDFSPVTGGGFVNADQFIGKSQADFGFAIVVGNAIVDAVFEVSEICFFVVVHWLPDRFFNLLLTNILTFHTRSPFLKGAGVF